MGKETSCYTCAFSELRKGVVYCLEDETEEVRIWQPNLFNCGAYEKEEN